MKNISFYEADKYASEDYEEVAPHIYLDGHEAVTSLAFDQEPELGEGGSPTEISQYPLEDILDHFNVFVSDFYDDVNASSEQTHLEFRGMVSEIRSLLSIIGKHVYTREDEDSVELVIE